MVATAAMAALYFAVERTVASDKSTEDRRRRNPECTAELFQPYGAMALDMYRFRLLIVSIQAALFAVWLVKWK